MPTSSSEVSLEPVWIDIIYDRKLQKITGKSREHTMCNKGCHFFFILQCVLAEYPAIHRTYAPGVLGFTVNGKPPAPGRPMLDGDVVEFLVCASTAVMHS